MPPARSGPWRDSLVDQILRVLFYTQTSLYVSTPRRSERSNDRAPINGRVSMYRVGAAVAACVVGSSRFHVRYGNRDQSEASDAGRV